MKEQNNDTPRELFEKPERDEMEEGKRSDVDKAFEREQELQQQARQDEIEKAFIVYMDHFVIKALLCSCDKGWWSDYENVLKALDVADLGLDPYIKLKKWLTNTTILSKIALMHTELAEATEGVRDASNKPDQHLPQFSQVAVELADLCIRVFDLAGKFEIPLAEAIVAKMKYNETRPFKHGKNV